MAVNKSNVRHLGVSKPAFEPTIGSNGSCAFLYNANNQMIQIDKTVGEFVYRKTLTWVGSNLMSISSWSKL